MSMSSSEIFDTFDFYFKGGWTLTCSVAFSSDLMAAEECDIIDTDGLFYIKREESFAPIYLGNRTSDITFYSNLGKIISKAESVSGKVFTPAQYTYALETPVGGNPFKDMVLGQL